MPPINDLSQRAAESHLRRFVAVERHEALPLITSFFMFFALLAAYYVIRPFRDEMGNTYGKGEMHELFTLVFLIMLAAVPLYGFIASRFPRRYVLPALYSFFVICLLSFYVVFRSSGVSHGGSGAFYIWGSVFNLFAVSLFWSLMSELWTAADAKRLFGFISAGGTAGALTGSLVTKAALTVYAPIDLLVIAAALLILSLALALTLRRLREAPTGHETEPAGGGIFDGAVKVLRQPAFAQIALFVLLANVVGTFFYAEMQRQAALAFTDSAARVDFFNTRELFVSLFTLAIEVFGTAAVFRRFGLTAALVALPCMALIGTLAIWSTPLLYVVAAAMVAERIVAFSLASPAVKVMYTLAKPDEKYKVQSFIDTVVYRGGDAASGWLFKWLGAGLGFATASIPLVALPLVVLWLWNARGLGRSYEARMSSQDAEVRRQ